MNYKFICMITMAILVTSSLVPVFASPYALQNPAGTANSTTATSGNTTIPSPTYNSGAITVTTDRSSYNYGDTITISGHTQDYITDTPITVIVKSPIGNLVKEDQVDLGSDRTYSTTITATGALWQAAGAYTVIVEFGSQDRTAQTTFQFTGSSGGTGQTVSPPPVTQQPPATTSKLPSWVRHIFIYYGQGDVSEDELLNAIKFLVNQGIMKLS